MTREHLLVVRIIHEFEYCDTGDIDDVIRDAKDDARRLCRIGNFEPDDIQVEVLDEILRNVDVSGTITVDN